MARTTIDLDPDVLFELQRPGWQRMKAPVEDRDPVQPIFDEDLDAP